MKTALFKDRFASTEENLACDHALLELAESVQTPNIIRFWIPISYCVVLGYSKKWLEETNPDFCEERYIPIRRRQTGGGTVLQGPGCLNYSLILRIDENEAFQTVPKTNAFIMKKNAEALQELTNQTISIQGVTDLTINDKKFNGNAQTRKKKYLLFHGSLLLRFDFSMMSKALRNPQDQPEYREGRSHQDFLTNFPASEEGILSTMLNHWNAQDTFEAPSINERIPKLENTFYRNNAWNLKR